MSSRAHLNLTALVPLPDDARVPHDLKAYKKLDSEKGELEAGCPSETP